MKFVFECVLTGTASVLLYWLLLDAEEKRMVYTRNRFTSYVTQPETTTTTTAKSNLVALTIVAYVGVCIDMRQLALLRIFHEPCTDTIQFQMIVLHLHKCMLIYVSVNMVEWT